MKAMRWVVLPLMIFATSNAAWADSFEIVKRGKTYVCESDDSRESDQVAVICYENCRDRGSGHPYCESVCDGDGVSGVYASCYRDCTASGSSDAYCRSTCR